MRKKLVDKYTYRVEWSKEDNFHIASCLEFPSLSTDGPTPEKAISEIKKVVAESIKWMKEEGEEIPTPFGEKDYSGKYALRMPVDIHREAAIKAAEQGVSLNQYLLAKISG
jgi:predicted HicB family RNase H-like nuclease